MFDVNLYNQLPSIAAASATFNSKLASAGLTIDTFLDKLCPLFSSDGNKDKYGIWLLHHHIDLEAGERMVKKGAVSEPTMDQSSNIVAERWGGDGAELEHIYAEKSNDIPSPPSPEFIKKFQEIISAFDIDCLGICYAPSQEELKILNAGYIFMETSNQGRRHTLTPIPLDDPSLGNESIFRTTWSISGDWAFSCIHACFNESCHTG